MRRKLKWKITFTTGVEIQNLLNNIKDNEINDPAGKYSIPCESCDHIYLGESMRLKNRIENHKGSKKRIRKISCSKTCNTKERTEN